MCRYHDEMCAKFQAQRPFRRPALVRGLCIYNECITLRLVNSYMTMMVLRSQIDYSFIQTIDKKQQMRKYMDGFVLLPLTLCRSTNLNAVECFEFSI